MQKLLIFGGTGTLGNNLVRRLKDNYEIIVISRDEDKQWRMKKEYPQIKYFLGDIRNKERINNIILEVCPNVIIIASALKHIDICESNIDECILTNIIGIQNILNSIIENSQKKCIPYLEKVIFISTDKAANPINVYGMSKSICEKMVIEKSFKLDKPKFVNVRYGNVLNSRGSLIPFFTEIGKDESKHHFPVTNKEMTRFFMTIDQSINLIINAINEGESGDTFIPKVDAFRIIDIAEMFSKKYKKPIKIIGTRPGEKLHECLITKEEENRIEIKENYYIIKNKFIDTSFKGPYTSEKTSENINISI